MYIGLHVKYMLLLSDFNHTWIFWTDFRKNLKRQTWKTVQSQPSCSMRTRTGIRTYMKKLVATLPNFVKVPENQKPKLSYIIKQATKS